MNPDGLLFRALNDFVGSDAWVDTLARFLVNDFVVLTIGALTLTAIWFGRSEREQLAVVVTLMGFALTLALVKFSWTIYFHPRPFSELDVKLLFYRPSMSSFPSLPIALAFCFAAGARLASRRAGIFLYVLGALYALARVYAGVHYPLDVAVGALIGAGSVGVIARLGFIAQPLANRLIALARRIHFA